MGMLFNTADTLEILRKTNEAFNRAGLNRIGRFASPSGAAWATLFAAMGTAAGKSYLVAQQLGLDFDTDLKDAHGNGNSIRSLRWQKYLKYLDTTVDTNPANGGAMLAASIAAAIKDATVTNPTNAIEFFAVPVSSAAAGPSVFTNNVNSAGDKVKVIVIATTPVDSM